MDMDILNIIFITKNIISKEKYAQFEKNDSSFI